MSEILHQLISGLSPILCRVCTSLVQDSSDEHQEMFDFLLCSIECANGLNSFCMCFVENTFSFPELLLPPFETS